MKNLAVFASGAGSNAENLIQYFNSSETAKVKMVVCNNPLAGVIEIAKKHKIPLHQIKKEDFQNEQFVRTLKEQEIDWLVLAGFLWMIPEMLIKSYPDRIINIHPALLPSAYGGKGMYGSRVHQAIIDAGEKETGITIHLVNEKYDEGEIIFKKKLSIQPEETAEHLAKRIHELEYKYYPLIIERLVMSQKKPDFSGL